MHTGQNSIAAENSLPQLGQVRWGSVLIFLTTPPRPQPKAAPRSAERCELGQHSSWRTVFLLHEQSSVALPLAHQIAFQNKFPAARVLWHRRLREALRARPSSYISVTVPQSQRLLRVSAASRSRRTRDRCNRNLRRWALVPGLSLEISWMSLRAKKFALSRDTSGSLDQLLHPLHWP